jgi:steryl-sulfatase
LTTWLFYSRKLAFTILLFGALGFFAGMWYTLSFTLLSRSSCLLYRNETIIEQPVHLENLTLRNTNEAVNFMKDTVHNYQKPFFLYMAYVKVHTALFTLPENAGRSRHGAYGDNVEELDWSVGQILQTLKTLGVENDTLVFFSSDNGPFLERGIEAGFCGRARSTAGQLSEPLRGAKGQTWECGIRVPGIIRWPGHVIPDQIIESVSSLLDFYPSLLDLWNVQPMTHRPLDGVSLWPGLKLAGPPPNSSTSERHTLFHYCGSTITAVRQGRYKAHYWTSKWDDGMRACPSVTICPCLGVHHSPPLLFDVEADPVEESPLDVGKHSDVLAMMDDAVREHQATLVPVPNQLETPALPWLFPCCRAHGWTRAIRLITNSCQC